MPPKKAIQLQYSLSLRETKEVSESKQEINAYAVYMAVISKGEIGGLLGLGYLIQGCIYSLFYFFFISHGLSQTDFVARRLLKLRTIITFLTVS